MTKWVVSSALWLDLSTHSKMVLLSLCENADEETGLCWPSQDYIAARCSLSERRVRDHLAALEAAGYIETLSLGRGDGHGGSRYTERIVNLDRIEQEGHARYEAFKAGRKTKRDGKLKGLGQRRKAAQIAGIEDAPDTTSSRTKRPVANRTDRPVGNRTVTTFRPDSNDTPAGRSEHFQPDDLSAPAGRSRQTNPHLESPSGIPIEPSLNADRAGEVWSAVLSVLRLRMTSANFESWLRPCRAVALDGDSLVIAAPTQVFDWVATRLRPSIEAALAQAYPDLSLQFRQAGEAA